MQQLSIARGFIAAVAREYTQRRHRDPLRLVLLVTRAVPLQADDVPPRTGRRSWMLTGTSRPNVPALTSQCPVRDRILLKNSKVAAGLL